MLKSVFNDERIFYRKALNGFVFFATIMSETFYVAKKSIWVLIVVDGRLDMNVLYF